MLKKVILFCITILLSGCVNTPNVQEPLNDNVYIEPINDSFLFAQLDNDLQNRIKQANGNKEYGNYQFAMIGKSSYDGELKDINNTTIHLNDMDEYLLEVVSVDCSHCKDMLLQHIEQMATSDIKTIQYFNVGDNESIKSLYKELDIEISSDITIISRDEGLNSYIKDVLTAETYPTLVAYKGGKVSFDASGYLDNKQLDAFYDCGFSSPIDFYSIKDSSGQILLDTIRTKKDVENSFSKENLKKLESLDNDSFTKDYTIRLIGKHLDFDKISNQMSSIYINEVEDFNIYKDKDIALIYTYLRNETDIEKVEYINSLIESNSDIEYIVVLIEGLDSSSSAYKKMNTKFNCKVVSVLGYCPDDFFTLGISNYPTAIFVEKSTFTGAYSNIDSIDSFNKAISMFIGKDSIALKDNN